MCSRHAVASGKQAARSVYRHVRGTGISFETLESYLTLPLYTRERGYETLPRRAVPVLPPELRLADARAVHPDAARALRGQQPEALAEADAQVPAHRHRAEQQAVELGGQRRSQRRRQRKVRPVVDAEVRKRFADLHERLTHNREWLDERRSCLARIIVLDQFSRNMFRDTPRMFAQDAQALKAATSAVERGWDKSAAFDERGFLYMPFMHAEDLAAQDRAVALFSAFRDELADQRRERIEMALDYAHRHRDIIGRFGRFPHRNALLGRPSTAEELEFLTQPGSSF